jgi:hypothetical protein
MKTLILFVLCFSRLSFGDDWTCKEESSRREGASIFACGIGTGKDEAHARASAFQEASGEFARICAISSDCANHETKVIPGRTTCEMNAGAFTCHRAVLFEIGDEKQPETKEEKPNEAKRVSISASKTSPPHESSGDMTYF